MTTDDTTSGNELENSTIYFGDNYQLLKKLGHGSFGSVYCALDIKSGNKVAIKIFPSFLAIQGKVLKMLEHEARALAGVDHPNLARFLGIAKHEDAYGIVMEYVDGSSLADMLKTNGKFAPTDVTYILLQSCGGLNCIHHLGIIHRDIKPANILITPQGVIKIVDLGLAHVRENKDLASLGISSFSNPSTKDLTSTVIANQKAIGSPAYIAPETMLDGRLSNQCDIYALGLTAYEMVTEVFPFSLKSRKDLEEAKRHRIRNTPHDLNPECPEELSLIIMKAIEPSTKDRYANTNELLADLIPIISSYSDNPLSSQSILQKGTSSLDYGSFSRQDRSFLFFAISMFFLLLILGVYILTLPITKETLRNSPTAQEILSYFKFIDKPSYDNEQLRLRDQLFEKAQQDEFNKTLTNLSKNEKPQDKERFITGIEPIRKKYYNKSASRIHTKKKNQTTTPVLPPPEPNWVNR